MVMIVRRANWRNNIFGAMVRKIGILCLLSVCLVAGSAHAQLKRVYQLSGLIVDRAAHKAGKPRASAHQQQPARHRGQWGRLAGIPVVENNTIYFSRLVSLPPQFVFADYIKGYQGDANSAYVYAINYL